MAKITRIATTVTARYFPGQGASDAFYLDGRLTGKRESRAADITLDREDRGFFLSVFAHQAATGKDSQSDILEQRPILDKILNDAKKSGRNIDAEINELADCGVSVAGRMILQHAGVRQPYFAGIVVKDQEIASITIGRGCAYLYRNEVLYPLTDDDFEMEEIDAFGRPVDNLEVYSAGVAGTVRYSNIAQLQMDDCLIACNREVMDALGQREVLRILYEAEDQCDAAGMIITEAAAKSPGASLQFMIGFVESATVADKPVRGFGLGRGKATGSGPSVQLPVAPADMSEVPALFGGGVAEEPVSVPEEMPGTLPDTGISEPYDMKETAGDGEEAVSLDIPDISESAYSDNSAQRAIIADAVRGKDTERVDMFQNSGLPEEDVDDEDDGTMYGRSRIGMYVIIALVTIATIAALYFIFKKPAETVPTTVATTASDTTTRATTASVATTAATDPSGTSAGTEATTVATATTPVGTISPDTPKDLPATYVVQEGNTLYRIALYYYETDVDYHVQRIRDENGLAVDENIIKGQSLVIPAIEEE